LARRKPEEPGITQKNPEEPGRTRKNPEKARKTHVRIASAIFSLLPYNLRIASQQALHGAH
jgi:hypothetical protein